MKIKNLIYLSFLPTALSAVTFRLIAPKGKPYVVINGNTYTMELHEYPVYKVKVKDAKVPVNYNYAIDYAGTTEESKGFVQENFERTLESGEETLNEYFERKITKKIHPALPKAYESYSKYSPSKLFDDTHVATVIINCNANEINSLHQDPTSGNKVYGAEFIYASPFSVRTFKNATIGISGQSTLFAAKLSYKISNLKNDKNKELYKRTGIKLRAEHMDPSFLRDKIYTDMLNSLGVPTAQNKFARVFINGEPIGLFTLSDNPSNKRYLRETLNSGTKFDIENPIYKADYFPPTAIGDLGLYGNDPASEKYSIYYYKGSSMDELGNDELQYERNIQMNTQHLIPFLQQIDQYPETKNLNFDIPMFLKFMAMEYITGAIDNYWFRPGNYYLYKNINFNDGEWLFLDSDFHYSFGVGAAGLNEVLSSTIDTYASLNQDVLPDRPLLDKIRSVQENENYFREVINRLINTAFHVDAIFPRIESLAELIREDVAWDFTLPRVSGYAEAEGFHYTMDDFEYQIVNEDDGCVNLSDMFPLRCWIRNKGYNVANEIGVEYPAKPDESLGFVETLMQTNEKNFASSVHSSITILIICLIITLFVNF